MTNKELIIELEHLININSSLLKNEVSEPYKSYIKGLLVAFKYVLELIRQN